MLRFYKKHEDLILGSSVTLCGVCALIIIIMLIILNFNL